MTIRQEGKVDEPLWFRLVNQEKDYLEIMNELMMRKLSGELNDYDFAKAAQKLISYLELQSGEAQKTREEVLNHLEFLAKDVSIDREEDKQRLISEIEAWLADPKSWEDD